MACFVQANDSLIEIVAGQLHNIGGLEKEVLERLFPGYGSLLYRLHQRPDLLEALEHQLNLGPASSIAACNVRNNGFGGV